MRYILGIDLVFYSPPTIVNRQLLYKIKVYIEIVDVHFLSLEEFVGGIIWDEMASILSRDKSFVYVAADMFGGFVGGRV